MMKLAKQQLVVVLLLAAMVVGLASACGNSCGDPCDLELHTLTTDSTVTRPISNVTCPYDHLNRGAWYRVTGTGNAVTVDTCDDRTDFDTMLYLFHSCAQAPGMYPNPAYTDCVDYDDDGCGQSRSKLAFQTQMGGHYYVFVTGFGTATGTYYLATADHVPPTNYHCRNAVNVTNYPYVAVGDTSTTSSVDDSCQNKKSAGLWYKVHGNGEPFVAHTCSLSTNYDTYLEVYLECNQTMASECITQNDDYCYTQSLVWWRSVMNQDYWIFVTGHGNDRGEFQLEVEKSEMNPNSKCSEPTVITTLPYVHTGDTSKMPSSYSPCNQRYMHAKWYRMAGIGRQVIVTTCDPDNTVGDTVIDVYSGCDHETHLASTCVATNDDYCGVHSAVIFYATAPLYYISVSGYSRTLEGVNYTLTVLPYENANNSHCWYAQEISSLPEDVSGNTRTQEKSNVGCSMAIPARKGAWFRYTHKSAHTLMTATTCNRQNILPARLEVHTNCHSYFCTAQADLDHSKNCTEVTFAVEPFVTYFIFVTAQDTENPGSYYHVDFFEHAGTNHSTCAGAEHVSTAQIPYRTEQYTGLSKPSWSACRKLIRQGYWVRIEGDGTKYVATTCDTQTDFDTVIELYDRCPRNNVSEGCLDYNDDYAPCGLASQLEWQTTRGAIYWLFVSGSSDSIGIFTLRVYSLSSPSHFHCLRSKGITALPYVDYGITTYAGLSNGSCESGTRKGLWYSFVGDGRWVDVETCGIETTFETEVEIYMDCTREGGQICLNHQHDSKCAPQTVVTFPAHTGAIYWVYVTGVRAGIMAEGFYKLSIIPGKLIPPESWSSQNSGKHLSPGAIVGIAIACICAVAIVAGLAAGIYVHFKKRRDYVSLPSGSASVQATQ